MDYPFPGPRYPAFWEWAPVAVLSVLAFLPLVRVVFRTGPPRQFDVACGFGGALLALVAGLTFPHIQNGLPHPLSTPVSGFTVLVVMVNFGWAFAAGLTSANTHKVRLIEIGIPYGLAIIPLFFICLAPGMTTRSAIYRIQCRNNLSRIGLAFHNYHDKFDRFPSLAERPGQPERSWRVDVLSYMDHAHFRNQYVDAAAWDSTQNLPIAKYHVPPLQCPSNPKSTRSDGLLFTGYAGVRGPNTAFPDGRGMSIRQFTDGTSNTLLIVEACGRQIVWTEPRDIDLVEQRVGVNLPGEQPGRSRGVISSYHVGGGHAAMGDGSVKFLSNNVDPAVLKALLTATGGEPITGEY
jgi:hypothetical protein